MPISPKEAYSAEKVAEVAAERQQELDDRYNRYVHKIDEFIKALYYDGNKKKYAIRDSDNWHFGSGIFERLQSTYESYGWVLILQRPNGEISTKLYISPKEEPKEPEPEPQHRKPFYAFWR